MYHKFLRPIVEHHSDRLLVVADRGSGKTTAARARYDFLKSRHRAENLRMLYVTNTYQEAVRLHRDDLANRRLSGPRNYLARHNLVEHLFRGTSAVDDIVLVIDQLTPKDKMWLVSQGIDDNLEYLESFSNIVSITVFSDPGVLVPEDWSIQRILIGNDDYVTKTYTQVY